MSLLCRGDEPLFVAILLCLFATSPMSRAQEKTRWGYHPNRLELATSLGMRYFAADSLHVLGPSREKDTTAEDSTQFRESTADTTLVVIKQRSALAAALWSAVIPGGGQIYNRSYWKLPIIYGLQAFFIYEWISNNNTYKSFMNQYEDSLKTAGQPPWSSQEEYYLSVLQGARDGARDSRDSYAWYMAGVYALSVLDAYIDAELSGFDVSPGLGYAPDGSAGMGILVRVKF